MEHTYRVLGNRASLFVVGIPFTLFGGLFAILGVLLALVDHDSSESSASRIFVGLMLAVGGSLAAYVGWDHLFRRPWLIRIWRDGGIEIQRAFQVTRLRAWTITNLEKSGRTVGLEDEDGRLLQIHHMGGSIPISYFAEIDDLIADIRTLNPYVVEHGRWDG